MSRNQEDIANQLAGNQAGVAELRSRLLFVLFALLVYRIGTHIPVPGIDPGQLQALFNQNQGGILELFNMFSGGAWERMSILALGVIPYITASIIMNLLTMMWPQFQQWRKEGEAGRRKITKATRYLTLAIALIQGTSLAVTLANQGLAFDPGTSFLFVAALTLVTGSIFMMWLGEQITARGIGNGISLIIFVGIIAELPSALAQFFESGRTGALSTAAIFGVVAMLLVTLTFVVFMERSLRKIHIQYPRRQVGMKVYDGGNSHLPIKVNPAGVIPAIFASSLLLLPTTIGTFSGQQTSPIMATILAYFGPGQPLYLLFFAVMIVFFTYFYTHNVAFKTEDVADNLKNQNGFIPGIRPGAKTAQYLTYVTDRVLVLGAGYLALVCLIPEMVRHELAITAYFGGTSILIIVSVGMDTVQQIQSHLLAHQYEGLIEKSQLRGKKRGGKKGPARR